MTLERPVLLFLGSGPEGADDLCFHTGEISPSPSPSVHPLRSSYSSLEADFGREGQGGTEKKEGEKEEKFLLCESIGHRPLQGRCPKGGRIVAKALDGQRYPLPLCEYMCVGERGSGPEGADDLCFVSSEALGLNLSHEAVI